MQILQIFWDRRELFITCLLEHIRISLTAGLCAGVQSQRKPDPEHHLPAVRAKPFRHLQDRGIHRCYR